MPEFRFSINDQLLRRLCQIYHFPIPDPTNEMILLGIRGALPPQALNSSFDFSGYAEFKDRHVLSAVELNYYFPRCMLGQWLPSQKKLALFPGSTVPNLGYILHRQLNRFQFNQLAPGRYRYEKGNHPASASGFQQHEAFRMKGEAMVRRNNYQMQNGAATISYRPGDSHLEVMAPADNIHAARNDPSRTLLGNLRNRSYSSGFVMSDYYSSYGCQVVLGNPRQYLNGHANGRWNAWDQFYQHAYQTFAPSQREFSYLLLDGMDVYQVSQQSQSGFTPSELRFGSSGDLVRRVQERLNGLNSASTGQAYYTNTIDGEFGPDTARAVIAFQNDFFNGLASGILDRRSAEAMGISNWPSV